VVVRVLPGEQRRPRRAAQRVGHEEAVERRALLAEQPPRAGHRAHRREVLIVGDHDDHVRALCRDRGRSERAGGDDEQRAEHGRRQAGRAHAHALRSRAAVA